MTKTTMASFESFDKAKIYFLRTQTNTNSTRTLLHKQKINAKINFIFNSTLYVGATK